MNHPNRRILLQLAGAAGLAAALPAARAAEGADLAKARAEGQAVFYANITAVKPIIDAFGADTGIKGQYTRISSSKFFSTISTEAQAGKLLADVVQAPLPVLELLKEKGLLAPYRSPEAAGYPDWSRPDDTIQIFGVEYVSYVFNKTQVKDADAPRRYEDLADPKWKGRIVMADPASHASTISWLVGLKEKAFGSEADWLAFVKGLAANQPMFVASFGPTPAPIESGEKAIAISMPKYIVTKAPAPLAWAPRGGQPLLGTPRAMAITAKAPHPAAARAFVDYWLGKKAAGLLAKDVGEYVLAPGVHPPIEGIAQVKVVAVRDLGDDEIQKWGAQFKQIFKG
ncbi:MAG: ABC transporter substrate-binding protein [Rubrivivax sp. SCN 71-131]|jgi:iron(III) transport system substrate-binding protein|nr:MAG: ABC transporter substrate-binding protein [Rubrivivax sp. SCN 71-131]